ncbi:hypothetical protein J6590_103666 [Homalodisca vitripennis]|nr:hypothetical protein J6590_103666 [Homalodisca vitripennis]
MVLGQAAPQSGGAAGFKRLRDGSAYEPHYSLACHAGHAGRANRIQLSQLSQGLTDDLFDAHGPRWREFTPGAA